MKELKPPPGSVVPIRNPLAPRPGEPIPAHFASCFGCGSDHPTGFHMQVTAGEGLTAEGIFTVTESHQGAPGLAHGGLLSAAIDEILASLNWLLGVPAVTGRLECDFRCPVPVGTTLIIQAWVESIHGRKVYTRALAHMNQPSGPLAIEAQALFIQVPLEHFAVHGNRVEIDAGTVNRRKAWTEMTNAAHLPTTDFDLNP